jgi:nicotinamidase-related amidase
MRGANDYGYWCTLLKDCAAATDRGNHEAVVKSIKMEGGIFGNVSDSKKFIEAVNSRFR